MLIKFIVCFVAGIGAGLGTGFAGMSAAAVISPMLITFLEMEPYMAVGIALASDVLASAVSAYTYYRHKNIDVKNGLVMMASVLVFTLAGSYLSSLVPSHAMGSFSVVMTFFLGIKFIVRPVMTTKESMGAVSPKKRLTQSIVCGVVIGLMRLCRRWRGHDDAAHPDQRSGLRAEDRGGHQRIYHDLYRVDRRGEPFYDRRRARPLEPCVLRAFHAAVGAARRAFRQ